MGSNLSTDRIKAGIIFNFSPDWMGGIVYIINLIRTLDYLDESSKPEIFLFYNHNLKKFVEEIKYSFLVPVEWQFPSVYKGYFLSLFLRKNIFIENILKKYTLDVLYPLHDFPVRTITKTKLIAWYADLQHKHYPGFFTRKKVMERNARIRLMLKNSNELIVSSRSVADDFFRFYRIRKKMKIHIYHFVSVTGHDDNIKIDVLKLKYKLPDKYFLVSNQFHKHKNHVVIFRAMALLKSNKSCVCLAVTGKLPSNNSPYINELYEIIENNNLHDQVDFLGVIPRNEQLIIMKHAQAVIQPSLFEGWSTVIEDAVSLQVPVIASSIQVNMEQLREKGIYFDPHDHNRLAAIMADFPERKNSDVLYEGYHSRMVNAANEFFRIIAT